MARFGDGFAQGPDLSAAAAVAAEQAVSFLRGRQPDVAWVFVSGAEPDESAAALERAATVTGARSTLGAVTASVASAHQADDGSSAVGVLAAVFPGVTVRSFHLEVMRVNEGLAVVGLPEPHADDELVLLLADPWSFPADGFAARIGDLSPGTPVVGGLVSAAPVAGSSRLLIDGRVVDRGAVGLVLSGPVGVRLATAHAAQPIGPPMTVTAVNDNLITGLAGTEAALALQRIVDELDPTQQALASKGVLLGIAVDEYAEAHLAGGYQLRPVLRVDRLRGNVSIGEPVQVGATVRFHVTDADAEPATVRRAAEDLLGDGVMDTVEGLLLLDCASEGQRVGGTLSTATGFLGGPAALAVDVASALLPVGGRHTLQGWVGALLGFGSGSAASRGTRST